MINFNLPDFYNNLKINTFFKNLSRLKQEYFKFPVNFYCFTGNLPYSFFSGGYNINKKYEKMNTECINLQLDIPICFNCSNINLNENDFYDNKLKTILDNNKNGSNFIEISNFDFLKFLKNNYGKYYNYILSSEINLLKELTSEEINILLETDNFKYISLTQKQSMDFVFLEKIKQKNKIEILINSDCDMKCKNWDKCRIEQHDAIYEFSTKNSYQSCFYQSNTNIPIEVINEKYVPLGFNHFKLSSVGKTEKEYFIFLLNYFIKEEYKIEVCKRYYDNY